MTSKNIHTTITATAATVTGIAAAAYLACNTAKHGGLLLQKREACGLEAAWADRDPITPWHRLIKYARRTIPEMSVFAQAAAALLRLAASVYE